MKVRTSQHKVGVEKQKRTNKTQELINLYKQTNKQQNKVGVSHLLHKDVRPSNIAILFLICLRILEQENIEHMSQTGSLELKLAETATLSKQKPESVSLEFQWNLQ